MWKGEGVLNVSKSCINAEGVVWCCRKFSCGDGGLVVADMLKEMVWLLVRL